MASGFSTSTGWLNSPKADLTTFLSGKAELRQFSVRGTASLICVKVFCAARDHGPAMAGAANCGILTCALRPHRGERSGAEDHAHEHSSKNTVDERQ